ncbi:hypothetical protein IAQ61_003824 [Plenodomus lingam]|uniref:uncharacterized protein n=1 Tax=Leptosphaeria maculans TaxID=5022 RepID=UPI003331B489|nr:hypothetical protein IAQ61_003824 [Plenodomus lingam]
MPSQRLSLASFEDFAGKKLSGPIAIFQDSKQYTFERKKPVNGHPVHPAKMLLVGRYHTQYAAFPNVWAHTVGAGITYYLSLPGTSLAKLAPDPARIYFTDEPFSRMVGGKEDEVLYTAHHAQRGYIPGTNKWRSVIEAAITFIFLKTGHLKYAYVADANESRLSERTLGMSGMLTTLRGQLITAPKPTFTHAEPTTRLPKAQDPPPRTPPKPATAPQPYSTKSTNPNSNGPASARTQDSVSSSTKESRCIRPAAD